MKFLYILILFIPLIGNAAEFETRGTLQTEGDGTWYPLSSGTNSFVQAIACSGNGVYVGGFFSQAGGVSASRIAKWNGTSWQALGSGVNGGVCAIACSGNDVYVGGYFTQAGGVPASYIAKWDGVSWSALGSGVNGCIYSIVCNGNDVYVGGSFSQAGGVPAACIAKWNGTNWSALGSGVGGWVNAIVCSGNNVYVGGNFNQAGNVSANYIVKWNGVSWSALGGGVSGVVYSIACCNSDVYVGGSFSQAGGMIVNDIAKWNGSSWSALGNGVGGSTYPYVETIACSGSDVYVGGWFNQAGEVSANYVAKWSNNNWSALGSGVNHVVRALAWSGYDLYAGGWFDWASGITCSHVAGYHTISPYENLMDISAGDLTIDTNRSIGCAWSDYDGDGDPDLFVANEGLQDNNNNMYINNGDGTFTGLTTGDVVTDGSRSQGGTWGDYNNDGYPDLFVSNANGEDNCLYENTNGQLYKVGIYPLTSDGGNSNGASWGDYDNDGYLDLFVANGGEDNFLYHNNGNSTFSKVTTGSVVTDGGASTSGAWCDYDLDGDLDLFVSNTGWNHNFLYTNNGDGTFTKVTTGDIVLDPGESFGGSWGDYDNDGYPDLYVPQSGQDNLLYHNNGDGTFTRITDGILVNDGLRSRSSGWGDLNLDGHLDLFVLNRNVNSNIHINNGDGTFSSYLIDPAIDGYGGAWSDYDMDGDLDLFMCYYGASNHLQAYNGNANHWLKVKCIGVESNRDGIGAKIKVKTGDGWQYREINTQSGFGGQSDAAAEFGLGSFARADEIIIEWPGGTVWDTTNVTADQMLIITEHVPSINQPPLAIDDSLTLNQNTTETIYVLTNDSDPDGDDLIIQSLDLSGTLGTAVIDPGDTTITYTAPVDYAGLDMFSYSITDGNSGMDTASVYIEILAVNHPPAAVDDTLIIKQDSTVTFYPLLNDSDPDNDPLYLESILDDDITGTVVINSGDTSIAYIPLAGWSGETAFDYVVSDGNGGLDTATVFITVMPVSAVEDQTVPIFFALHQNYPNPFNPVTAISYALPEKSHVTLRVFSVMGSEICTLVNGEKSAGQYEATWNARDRFGHPVSSGIYFYQLKAGEFTQIRKMLLVR